MRPRSPAEAHTIVIFARAPELGRGKTRLAKDIGADRALGIYRELAERTLRIATSYSASYRASYSASYSASSRADAATGPSCGVMIAFTPGGSAHEMRTWLGAGPSLVAQGDGSLGDRLHRAIARASSDGATRIVVLGTDCPGVDEAILARAFASLDDADVVLGPATDGGYYLIGMRAPHRELFEGIPWSTSETLGATKRAAHAAGLRVALLEEHRDIDTADDWLAWTTGGGM